MPVERYAAAYYSNDSGDHRESEPEEYGHGYHHRPVYHHAQTGSIGYNGGHGGHGYGSHYDYRGPQEEAYHTADSSDDLHHYLVTEYETEEFTVEKKVPYTEVTQVPYQVAVTNYISEPYEVETLEPYTVDVEVPYTIEAQVPFEVAKEIPFVTSRKEAYTVTHEIPYVVTHVVPYTVTNKVPYEEPIEVPFEVTQRIDYTVIKKVPYVVSKEVEVTQYEKEAFQVEKKFPITVYDKTPYTIEVKVPYVEEHQVPYTAQIQVPYEVTHEEERTIYEIEEYTVEKHIPFVVENPFIHIEYDTEHFTLPETTTVEHSHPVAHTLNFGTTPNTINEVTIEVEGEKPITFLEPAQPGHYSPPHDPYAHAHY